MDLTKAPDLKKIYNFLNTTPPVFDLSRGLSFKQLSDGLRKGTNRNQGLCVNVYDNGKLVEGSPFASYAKAALALGNVNISSIISKKIGTNKLYKKRYLFVSVKTK